MWESGCTGLVLSHSLNWSSIKPPLEGWNPAPGCSLLQNQSQTLKGSDQKKEDKVKGNLIGRVGGAPECQPWDFYLKRFCYFPTTEKQDPCNS